jgi:hypothetical protein
MPNEVLTIMRIDEKYQPIAKRTLRQWAHDLIKSKTEAPPAPVVPPAAAPPAAKPAAKKSSVVPAWMRDAAAQSGDEERPRVRYGSDEARGIGEMLGRMFPRSRD